MFFSFHLFCGIEAIDSFPEKESYLRFYSRDREERQSEYWNSDPLDHIPYIVEGSELGIPSHDMNRENTWDDDSCEEHREYEGTRNRNREGCERVINR